MIAELGEPPSWPRRGWWGVVTLIFLLQLNLIFWLGQRETPHPGLAARGPRLNLVEGKSPELLALIDPTLFALPHRDGFSGLAWLKNPTQDLTSFTWSEPSYWLNMSTPPLGAAFELFIVTNAANLLETLSQIEPQVRLPMLPPSKEFPEYTRLRLTGDLAKRRLLSVVDLPSWPNPEILTNSRVQLVVDAAGKPVSAALLYPGSGYKDADTNALWQAIKARFEPVPGSATNLFSGLSWGQMVFEWHTLPLALTNSTHEPK